MIDHSYTINSWCGFISNHIRAFVQDASHLIAECQVTNLGAVVNIVLVHQHLLAQVVSRVVLLGTGAIIKTNDEIHELTTASTLWIRAVIGLTFG